MAKHAKHFKYKKITEILPEMKEHVVIRPYNTFHVGGVADYFYQARSTNDLVRAVRLAVEYQIPYFILGNGSNILFSDYGFPGLVIQNLSANIAVMKEKSQIIADSGAALARVIIEAAESDLSGLEFLYGIPGTIGGAVYGNAGSYGHSIGDYIKNITLLILDPKDNLPQRLQIVQYDHSWMDFDYRGSKLKKIKSKTKPVILSVKLQLAQNQKEDIMRKLNHSKELRTKTQPVGFSAGCVFKNPIPSELKNITGRGTHGMPELPKERRAGFMLDQAGVKKMRIGEAEVSNIHANFIVNQANAKASDIRTLIEEMREKVAQKFHVTLEEEIEYIGQW